MLALVVASVVFQVAAPEGDGARLGTVALGAVTVLAAVRTAGVPRRVVQVGGAAAWR